MKTFNLPCRVDHAGRILNATNPDGGWSVFACRDLAHALEVMAAHPRAAMPCWRRITAAGVSR